MNLDQVVQRAKADIAKKYVYVMMPIPQLETLLKGLEALQEYADDEGMRVSDAIAERDGWEKEAERLRTENTAMKEALEAIASTEGRGNDIYYTNKTQKYVYARNILSTLTKEENENGRLV